MKRRWGALRKHRQHATSLLGVIDQRVDSCERPMAGGMVKVRYTNERVKMRAARGCAKNGSREADLTKNSG